MIAIIRASFGVAGGQVPDARCLMPGGMRNHCVLLGAVIWHRNLMLLEWGCSISRRAGWALPSPAIPGYPIRASFASRLHGM